MSIDKELDFAPELPVASSSRVIPASSVRRTILSGSMILLIGTAFVSAVNLVYNILLARSLGAAGFGHAVSIYTLLMLLSAITLSYQLVGSKFVAKNVTFAGKAEVYQSLHRRAWYVGAVVGTTLVLASKLIAGYLNLPSALLIVWLGVGTAFYIPLGVRRGALQGMYEFRRLSVNFILEVLVKLGATLALLALNLGVEGVAIAVSASVLVAYLNATPSPEIRVAAREGLPASFLEGVQAIVFFIGQVIISNIDILLVKHFFPPTEAGLYAAVAVVGRVVFMASWAVVSSMFPVSAGVQQVEPQQRRVVSTPLILVASIGGLAAFGLWLLPDIVWKGIFGVGFQLGGEDWLPILYVAATTIYCFSVVLIAYEMSRKIGNTGWLQLLFSFAIALGIYMFHDTLRQVILVQLVLMAMLLICVAVPFFRFKPELYMEDIGFVEDPNSVVKLRRASEAEVLAEFLKNEFYQPQFHRYWERLEKLVLFPDLSDERENDVRRALLFRRRGRMWRELPRDTEWWQVQIDAATLARLRIFPRSHWRKIAGGNFRLGTIAARVRGRAATGLRGEFLTKIRSLNNQLREPTPRTAVLLIGIDETSPLTIIEGNHRLVAAMLLSAQVANERFNFFCGFSPKMTECCWYKTDAATLWRYAKNTVRYISRDRDAALESLLEIYP